MSYERSKKGSIIFKVTFWYSFFIVVIIILMIVASLLLSDVLFSNQSRNELVQASYEAIHELHDLDNGEDGIYFSIYGSQSHEVLVNNIPLGFDDTLPFTNSTVEQYISGSVKYLYYDLPIDEQRYLRSIMTIKNNEVDMSLFITAITIIGPLLLVIIVVGGYRILKKAISPVDHITNTALEIKESNDYSKRINVKANNNELFRLANTFNLMLESIEQTFQREKQFNNDVSHELRTPVAVILSESEYGKNYAENLQEAQESFAIINKKALQMKEMIDQIMELAKQKHHQSSKLAPFDLSTFIAQHTNDYQKLCSSKHITLTTSIDQNCMILADATLMHRLVDNLFSNALKFTNNTISIEVKKEHHTCSLSILDNGIGISEEHQKKIWNRFYQIDDARNKDSKLGSGLGLSLVKSIVDLHNANIELHSKPKEGSHFRVTFPLLQ